MATDPLDALRLPPQPTNPRPAFAAALRRRIQAALTTDPRDPTDGGTAMTTHAPAARLRHITPYLCAKNARAAIAWYQENLGARLEGEPFSMDGSPFDDNSLVGHCELWFGDSVVYLSDEWPEGGVLSPETIGGAGAAFVLDVPTPADVDAVYERAVANGATPQRPPADQFHGARAGWLRDPFGFRWSIASALSGEVGADADVPLIEATRGATPAPSAFQPWNEVGYFTIAVADLDKARAFYGGLFGWDLPAPDGPYLHNPSSQLPMGFTAVDEAHGEPTLFYRVRDIGPLLERVRALGGEVVSTDTYDSGPNAVCRDDQGNEFQLWQPAEGY